MDFTKEMSSDITVHVGGTSFSLHTFPLVSRCGYIKKLISESGDPDLSKIELPDIPGGEKAFELATKFCYGINFEICSENIAMLRCVSEYLQMTEEFAIKNLVGRTEAYLNEVALKNLKATISILHSSQNFLKIAEEVKLVSRCIDAIAYLACIDTKKEGGDSSSNSNILPSKNNGDWWAEDLIVLRIDLFQRVLIALLARGFKHRDLGPILMLYAEKSLKGLDKFGMGRKKVEPRQEHEKRVIVETIASLLPKEKNTLSVSFLSFLLRAAIHLDTTISCRLDLEKRIASQLGQAVLDDLLIPSFSITGETLYDVETIKRVLMNFLENEVEDKSLGRVVEENGDSTSLSEMEKVGKLMESYLAEIASDRNLSVSKFVGFAEIIPEQSRVTEDGMYRALDTYLKAHPSLNDVDKKKVCGIMNCQKLSPEACAHAAQNDRLSVQAVLQVLYFEQQRLRESVNITFTTSPMPTSIVPSVEEFSKLKKENESLKLELMKMKVKMKKMAKDNKSHVDKSHVGSPSDSSISSSSENTKKAMSRRKSFMNNVSRKLGRLYPFPRVDENGITVSENKPRRESVSNVKPRRNRRFSVS